jgi:hypothetical protein
VHPTPAADGLSDCCSYTQGNQVNFFCIVSGCKDSCTLTKNHGDFISDQPYISCCSLTKLSIQLFFWSIGHLGVARTHKIHASTPAADGLPASDCCSYTRIIRSTFFIISGPQICVYSQNHGTELYSDQAVVVLTKVIGSCFLVSAPPPKVFSYSQNASDTTGGGWARLSDCCSYTQN